MKYYKKIIGLLLNMLLCSSVLFGQDNVCEVKASATNVLVNVENYTYTKNKISFSSNSNGTCNNSKIELVEGTNYKFEGNIVTLTETYVKGVLHDSKADTIELMPNINYKLVTDNSESEEKAVVGYFKLVKQETVQDTRAPKKQITPQKAKKSYQIIVPKDSVVKITNNEDELKFIINNNTVEDSLSNKEFNKIEFNRYLFLKVDSTRTIQYGSNSSVMFTGVDLAKNIFEIDKKIDTIVINNISERFNIAQINTILNQKERFSFKVETDPTLNATIEDNTIKARVIDSTASGDIKLTITPILFTPLLGTVDGTPIDIAHASHEISVHIKPKPSSPEEAPILQLATDYGLYFIIALLIIAIGIIIAIKKKPKESKKYTGAVTGQQESITQEGDQGIERQNSQKNTVTSLPTNRKKEKTYNEDSDKYKSLKESKETLDFKIVELLRNLKVNEREIRQNDYITILTQEINSLISEKQYKTKANSIIKEIFNAIPKKMSGNALENLRSIKTEIVSLQKRDSSLGDFEEKVNRFFESQRFDKTQGIDENIKNLKNKINNLESNVSIKTRDIETKENKISDLIQKQDSLKATNETLQNEINDFKSKNYYPDHIISFMKALEDVYSFAKTTEKKMSKDSMFYTLIDSLLYNPNQHKGSHFIFDYIRKDEFLMEQFALNDKQQIKNIKEEAFFKTMVMSYFNTGLSNLTRLFVYSQTSHANFNVTRKLQNSGINLNELQRVFNQFENMIKEHYQVELVYPILLDPFDNSMFDKTSSSILSEEMNSEILELEDMLIYDFSRIGYLTPYGNNVRAKVVYKIS